MIRSARGNLWDYEKTHLLVIPTNIGWKADGKNIMGRGLAQQAAERYPGLPSWYGDRCRTLRSLTPVLRYLETHILTFPVKPLNKMAPYLSWRNKATIALIEQSTRQLAERPRTLPVAVSMVGCGNGGLDMAEVRPVLDSYLSGPDFVLVLL